MFKRLYSKRSGFTLVEIVIAFAVFAIMASMIVQILNLAVSQRQSNNEYANKITQQQEALYTRDRSSEAFDDAAGDNGTINMVFNDGSSLPIDYQAKSVDGSEGDFDGLTYFLGDVDYTANGGSETLGGTPGSAIPGHNTGSQAARLDTRILGSRDFGSITVKVSKTACDASLPYYKAGVSNRYTFEIAADGSGMDSENKKYAQFAMLFADNAKKAATFTNFRADSGNSYLCMASGKSGAKITVVGSPSAWSGMNASSSVKFTVDFVKFDSSGDITEAYDPQITAKSFGDNASGSDSSASYAAYEYDEPQYNEDGTPKLNVFGDPITEHQECANIYGAFPRETTPAPAP